MHLVKNISLSGAVSYVSAVLIQYVALLSLFRQVADLGSEVGVRAMMRSPQWRHGAARD